MEFVKPPEPFVFEGPSAPQRWERWKKQFHTYFVAAELGGKSKEVQVARLLNAAGAEAQEVHEQFVFARGVSTVKGRCKQKRRISSTVPPQY